MQASQNRLETHLSVHFTLGPLYYFSMAVVDDRAIHSCDPRIDAARNPFVL